MNRLMITLPDAVFEQLQVLAKQEGVSVSQYVTYAVAKQIERVDDQPPAGNVGNEIPGGRNSTHEVSLDTAMGAESQAIFGLDSL
ncbi:MAG: hypothetical protein AAFR58_11530 [Cyanobacteria bacterium J06627_28]